MVYWVSFAGLSKKPLRRTLSGRALSGGNGHWLPRGREDREREKERNRERGRERRRKKEKEREKERKRGKKERERETSQRDRRTERKTDRERERERERASEKWLLIHSRKEKGQGVSTIDESHLAIEVGRVLRAGNWLPRDRNREKAREREKARKNEREKERERESCLLLTP